MEDFIKQYENYRLCYVDSSEYISEPMTLYFTELDDIKKQWGDDWDDRPYEHNAGEPYEEDTTQSVIKVENGAAVYPKIDILKIILDNTYGIRTPRTDTINSPYSVEDINNKIVPWLTITDSKDKSVFVQAGTTFKDVMEILEKNCKGVEIFVKYRRV